MDSIFDSYPDFLEPRDLVDLGIYKTVNSACSDRACGRGPTYIKLGPRKHLYEKSEVIRFLKSRRAHPSDSKKEEVGVA
jgi:hypothetical protein